MRSHYFDCGNPQYHGGYFTRLGGALARAFFPELLAETDKREIARSVFRKHAAKLDLIPWWSKDVGRIDPERIDPELEPVRAWQGVIGAALAALDPTAVVINGCSYPRLIERLLGCSLERFGYLCGDGSWSRALVAAVGASRTPLLVHRQLNARGGPGHDDYVRMVDAWRPRCR